MTLPVYTEHKLRDSVLILKLDQNHKGKDQNIPVLAGTISEKESVRGFLLRFVDDMKKDYTNK